MNQQTIIHFFLCSGPPTLLNMAGRFAAKAVRLTLPSTFYCGLVNILKVCSLLLDLAAGVNEILYLRTR
jgi:hypothetical protein